MNLLNKNEVAMKLHMTTQTFLRHLRLDWTDFPESFPLTNSSNAQRVWIEPDIDDWVLKKDKIILNHTRNELKNESFSSQDLL